MKSQGKLIAKYEVISTSKNKKQKFAIKKPDGNVLFIHAWNDKLIDILNSYNLGEEVIVEYLSNGKETSQGKIYINNSLVSIYKSQSAGPVLNGLDYKEFYKNANPNAKKILDSTYNQLMVKHFCNLDQFEYFYQALGFVKKYGEEKANSQYFKLLNSAPTKITNSNLEELMFGSEPISKN